MTVRNMRRAVVSGLIWVLPALVWAQQGKLAGPVAGYVFDGAGHALRPIQGVPGAALLGEPVALGFDLTAAYVSPRQDAAVVVAADQSLHLFRWVAGTPTEIGLGGLSGAPQAVVFSPSGSAALLVAGGKARVLTGLPGAPVLVATVALPEADAVRVRSAGAGRVPVLGGLSAPLAVSDDGGYLLTVAGGTVRLLSIQGENRVLLPAGPGAQLAFAAGGHDAAVVDSLSGVTLLRDVAGAASARVLPAAEGRLAVPTGLAFAGDGLTVYVASARAQSVAAFDVASGNRTVFSCACAPNMLMPMGNLFRLNNAGADPLWLLEAGAANPRIVFVPARGE